MHTNILNISWLVIQGKREQKYVYLDTALDNVINVMPFINSFIVDLVEDYAYQGCMSLIYNQNKTIVAFITM